jgi:hypothetical protein
MAGLSQRDVAALLQFKTTDCISRWEKGVGTPPVVILLQLSLLYAASPIHLYVDLWESLKQEISLQNSPISEDIFITNTSFNRNSSA